MHSIRIIFILASLSLVASEETANSGYKVFQKILHQCSTKDEMFKCLKIQALKIADRAVHMKSLNLMDGVSLVSDGRMGKSLNPGLSLNESKLQKLESSEIDNLLADRAAKFIKGHRLKVNLPKMAEESRKKKKGGGYGALFWALAIKGSFLAMAYKGIAVMAGTALIVGKMALLLSAILGLKKLVSSGHETTTFEIIKQPKYSESHTHSTSYEDDGHYHRSSYDYDDTLHAQKRVYRAYIPTF